VPGSFEPSSVEQKIPLVTDTRFTIETPEGADLPLEPAGVPVRVLAYLIDWFVRFAIGFAFSTILGLMGVFGGGIFLIIFFLLEWFYPVFFEVYRDGKTPGKKKMGLRVVHDDSTPVGFSSSLIRNLLRFVDFLPLLYVSGIITTLFNKRFQRLGDLAAGTMVVYEHSPILHPHVEEKGSPIPAPYEFSTEEKRALLNFAERCPSLSLDRQNELAQQLLPVLRKDVTKKISPVKIIKRMAKTLVDPV